MTDKSGVHNGVVSYGKGEKRRVESGGVDSYESCIVFRYFRNGRWEFVPVHRNGHVGVESTLSFRITPPRNDPRHGS